MRSKFTWLGIRPLSTDKVAEMSRRMLDEKCDKTKAWGFDIREIRKGRVVGRYIERDEYTEELVDPFGNVLQWDRTVYREVEFRLGVGWPQLELVNAPRNVTGLLTRLGEYCDYKSSISVVSFEPTRWIEAARGAVRKVVVEMAVAKDIAVSPTVSGQVTLSGASDVIGEFGRIVGTRGYRLECARVWIDVGSCQFKCVIRSSGSVTVLDQERGRVERVLRKVLMGACQKLEAG